MGLVWRAQKVPKMTLKKVLRFSQNDTFKYYFLICFRKIWFLSCGPITSRQIRMQGSLNYNISQTRGVKMNF